MKYVILISLFIVSYYVDSYFENFVDIDFGLCCAVIDPLIGSALIGAGSSLVGSIFGGSNASKNLKAQREANATNLQISRENNAANLSLAREQNDWNLAQWHREMAYNTPESQIGRYTSAGINPYMAMNQLTNGNSSSNLQSANLANQTPASVNAVLGDSPEFAAVQSAQQSFIQMANAVSQLQKTSADTTTVLKSNSKLDDFLDKRNQIAGHQAIEAGHRANIAGNEEKISKLHASEKWLDNEQAYQTASVAMAHDMVFQAGYEAQKSFFESRLAEQNLFAAKTNNKWLEKNNQLQFASGLASIYQIVQGVDIAKQQLKQGWRSLSLQERSLKIQEYLAPAQYNSIMANAVKTWNEAHHVELTNYEEQLQVNYLTSIMPYKTAIDVLNLHMINEATNGLTGFDTIGWNSPFRNVSTRPWTNPYGKSRPRLGRDAFIGSYQANQVGTLLTDIVGTALSGASTIGGFLKK